MNESELYSVEQRIRDLLTDTGMDWVLDEVDAAIAAGVPEEKILRRRSHRGGGKHLTSSPMAVASQYEVVERQQLGSDEYEASHKKGTLVITTRTMTSPERVKLLLDALRRIFVELPEIELETLKTLRTSPNNDEGTRSEVRSVAFEPDENARHRRERSVVLTEDMPQERRERIRGILANLAAEVDD
ncbi:hypothetical protein BJF83_21670 [Nocardiopsis sp. CNR-923]|uniref:hypothetical protein n=1 Tax=Nocardiopsis sp. CNR-923 TaxID=1904965 RepID=UPI000959E4BC|nr:hypothetical protein [Nocardiopsis sp. CNR-923]OLT26292.1 hypothetical protein BJF83_21670 [Nocardiopsis sp. CNR-923]